MTTPLPRLGLFSPSFWLDEAVLNAQVELLRSYEFQVKIHPQNAARWGQFAGTPEERAAAFHDLLEDKEVDAILATRGGYGCLQWLDLVNFDKVHKADKPVLGYSDVTPLLNAIAKHAGTPVFHAPMLTTYSDYPEMAAKNIRELKNALSQPDSFTLQGETVQKGSAEGVLLGGNMTLLDQAIGTPFFPVHAPSVILLMEDVGIKINDIDKYLLHLKHIGFLQRVKGVVAGEFVRLGDNEVPFGLTLPETIQRVIGKNIPLIINTPCGHGERQVTLPLGVNMRLEVAFDKAVLVRT